MNNDVNKTNPQHEFDVESEMTQALSAEIIKEIDTELRIEGSRRSLLYIKQQINEIMTQYLFEPNDQMARSCIRSYTEECLQMMQDVNQIYDYNVVCDETNNPTEIIDAGKLHLDVYVKPIKSIDMIWMKVKIEPSPIDIDVNKTTNDSYEQAMKVINWDI